MALILMARLQHWPFLWGGADMHTNAVDWLVSGHLNRVEPEFFPIEVSGWSHLEVRGAKG